jgi:cell wall-associated NlpC family hydrolase
LVVSALHMGIVIGPNQMVSALNSKLGTKITPIAGYFTGPVFYGRLK